MPRIALTNMRHFIDDLLRVAQQTGQDQLLAAGAPVQWRAGLALLQMDDEQLQLAGYVLVLEALNRSPAVLSTLLRQLCGGCRRPQAQRTRRR